MVLLGGLLAMPVIPGATSGAVAAPVGQGFNLNRSDLRFIKRQMDISERHTQTRTPADPCSTLLGTAPDQIPNGNQQGMTLPWGLRTVDGSCNNLVPGKERLGAADETFPRMVPAKFRGDYARKAGNVFDPEPRRISNLIVDQTEANPAAVEAAAGALPDASGTLPIPNVAPDVGLSAPYNSMFTLFGQFFDHGLDLVNKGGGTVFIPLDPTDPLYTPGSPLNFMVLSRATNQPGPDGILKDDPATAVDESADNITEHLNRTTPFVDQNQTYTSHPSHQVFLREYSSTLSGPRDTGKLMVGASGEGMATWGDLKEQAQSVLGITLTDLDVLDVPLLATDPYGNFVPGANGYPQLVTASGLVEGSAAGTAVPADAVRTGHSFLVDIAHHAVPTGDRNPADGPGPVEPLDPDTNPGTTDDGDFTTYDDEMLAAHFIAGDGRVNENIGLTSIHHVFHSEHNRLVSDIDNLITTLETPANIDAWHSTTGPAGWNYEQRLFQAARFVTEMEYQHLVFEEFARKIQPMVNEFGEGGTGYRTEIDPRIRAEFAHVVYRFGHSMLTEDVARKNADGSRNDVRLLDAFLTPPEFLDGGPAGALSPDQAAGSVVRGMTRQVGNEMDEFVTGALRNNLLGLPLDLASLNLARARDTGVPRLNEARRAFYGETANSALNPYESWADFRYNLRHAASLVNFIAAYGTHPSIQGSLANRRQAAQDLLDLASQSAPVDPQTPEEVALAADITDAYNFINSAGDHANQGGRTVTGVDDIDLWVGGLAEKPAVFGGMLGSTMNFVFEVQMEDLQDGDRFYYLSRTAGLNMLTQLEGNSFAELVMRNTDVEGLPADAFSRPDFVFDVGNLGTSGAVPDDPATPDWDENQLLTRLADGTIRFGGGEHAVFNGTAGRDRIWASEGDDTLRGNDGDDWMQGGDGNDNHIGGLGDDILMDIAGDDTIKGGDGDDAISSGQGFGGDLNQGGRGKDFIVGGNDSTETFAGPGDDFIFAGDGTDTVFGDDGDDWIEDGKGPFSLLQGDNGAPFQDDSGVNEPGHDVLNGDGGEQDYDAEGGDDVMMAGPGIQRNEGMLGFDWVTHKEDPLPADSDMSLSAGLPPAVEVNRDRFDLVEALSGWQHDDVLRGDDRTVEDLGTDHELNQAGIDRVSGLADVLPAGTTSFNAGNILFGGAGSDLIEGRGGDDFIDGDVWLNARLSVRTDPSDPATEIGSADGMRRPYLAGSPTTLQQAVFAGDVDPGNIVIVREVLPAGEAGDVDTAQFDGPLADYTLSTANGIVTVVDDVGTNGTDTLRNVERLQFSDFTIDADLTPELVSTTPADGAVGVARGADLTGTFSIPVTSPNWGAAVQLRSVATGDGVPDVVTYDAATRTVTVDPNGNLAPGESYRLTFLGTGVNGIRDAAGNRLPNTTITFTTEEVTLPELVSTTPINSQLGVLLGSNLSGTFNVDVTSPNWRAAVQLRSVATGNLVPRVVTYNAATRTVTVNPNRNLVPGESYRLTFLGTGPNGIRTAAGDRLPNTTMTFTTELPAVISTTPTDGATGVARGANLSGTFNIPVRSRNWRAAVRLRRVATGRAVPRVVTYNARTRTVTVNPRRFLARNASYRLIFRGTGRNGIRDAAGNRLPNTAVTFVARP